MKEKRTAPRTPLNHPTTLRIEDDPVQGVLVDLSSTGALFVVEGEEQAKIDPGVLGLEASFVIKPKGKPLRRYTGELVRFFTRDDRSHIALRFWKGFEEIASP